MTFKFTEKMVIPNSLHRWILLKNGNQIETKIFLKKYKNKTKGKLKYKQTKKQNIVVKLKFWSEIWKCTYWVEQEH